MRWIFYLALGHLLASLLPLGLALLVVFVLLACKAPVSLALAAGLGVLLLAFIRGRRRRSNQ